MTSSACNSSTQPGAGTCMPDLNPAYGSKAIRQNGSWGKGITASTFNSIHYLKGYIGNSTPGAGADGTSCTSSSGRYCNAQAFMIGDAPRTMAFGGLREPSVYNLNASLRRTFDITERWKFIFGVDCQNVTNKMTFGGIQANVNNANFGTVSSATGSNGSRDFQFSGRINF